MYSPPIWMYPASNAERGPQGGTPVMSSQPARGMMAIPHRAPASRAAALAPHRRRRICLGVRGTRGAGRERRRRGGGAPAGSGGDRRLRRSLSPHRRSDQQAWRAQCHGSAARGRGQELHGARRQCRCRPNPDPARGYPSHAGAVGACAHRLPDGGKLCPPGRRPHAHRQGAQDPGPGRKQRTRLRRARWRMPRRRSP